MDTTKFEKLVRARANERVQARIKTLKKDVNAAIQKYAGPSYTTFVGEITTNEHAIPILTLLARPRNDADWPQELWHREADKVREELFGVMDEMQKSILAADRSADSTNTPAKAD